MLERHRDAIHEFVEAFIAYYDADRKDTELRARLVALAPLLRPR